MSWYTIAFDTYVGGAILFSVFCVACRQPLALMFVPVWPAVYVWAVANQLMKLPTEAPERGLIPPRTSLQQFANTICQIVIQAAPELWPEYQTSCSIADDPEGVTICAVLHQDEEDGPHFKCVCKLNAQSYDRTLPHVYAHQIARIARELIDDYNARGESPTY